jgi:hypothetical protein
MLSPVCLHHVDENTDTLSDRHRPTTDHRNGES